MLSAAAGRARSGGRGSFCDITRRQGRQRVPTAARRLRKNAAQKAKLTFALISRGQLGLARVSSLLTHRRVNQGSKKYDLKFVILRERLSF